MSKPINKPQARKGPLRARGDVPTLTAHDWRKRASAPRPRRCPGAFRVRPSAQLVRSAPAEMSRC